MKLLSIAALVAALATPVFAHPTTYHPMTAASDHYSAIPAEFDPGHFTIKHYGSAANFIATLSTRQQVAVHKRPHQFVWEVCGAGVYACEWDAKNDLHGSIFAQIVIDEAIPASMFLRVLRHELAHAIGWTH